MARRFKLEVGSATEVGRQRRRNEDRYATHLPPEDEERPAFLLVADGMGGERGGDKASQLAVERLLETFATDAYRSWPEFRGGDGFGEVLEKAVRLVSDEIYRLGESDPELHGLGTTLVLVAVEDDRAAVVHVGDSRCYRIRNRKIEQLTCDHTWVEDQVGAGVLTREAARQHPQRSILTRTLGDAVSPTVDVCHEDLVDGDLFILCSDGLTTALTDDEILKVAGRYFRPQDVAEALTSAANKKDGSDNITVVAARCRDLLASRYGFDPEDTEPLSRPRDLHDEPAISKCVAWLVLGVLLGLLFGYLGLSLYKARVYERGVRYHDEENYLYANGEFLKLLSIGLGEERSQRVLTLYGEYLASRQQEDEPDPGPAAGDASGNDPPP